MTTQDMLDTDDSSGLLGHFIGTVNTSWWSSPMAETNGKETADWAQDTRLYWDVSVDDALQEEYGGTVPESITLTFTCGKGWFADEKGREVRHEDDPSDEEVEAGTAKAKMFRGDSLYGKFINLCIGKTEIWSQMDVMDGGPDLEVDLVDVGKFLREHRTPDPRDAKVWEGIQFEFRGMGREWTNRAGEKVEARMKALPVRMVDSKDITTNETPAAAEVPRLDSAWVDAGADVSTVTTLNALANAASSHNEFLKNAALLPAVSSNEGLLKVLEATTDGPWT